MPEQLLLSVAYFYMYLQTT